MDDCYIIKERGSNANGMFPIFYMLSFYWELLTVLSWMFWKVMTGCKLHDVAGSVTGCVFHRLMLEADWLENAWEEQKRSMLYFLVNFHIMEPLWWLWQKQEGNVVVVVTRKCFNDFIWVRMWYIGWFAGWYWQCIRPYQNKDLF